MSCSAQRLSPFDLQTRTEENRKTCVWPELLSRTVIQIFNTDAMQIKFDVNDLHFIYINMYYI